MIKVDIQLKRILGKKNFDKIKNYSQFYKKVWLTVLKIPRGKIKTYKWVAQQIGLPNAYRAVGSALKSNPLTGIIPCHRIVKTSGELGGYSLGVKKKYKLLISEGVRVTRQLKIQKVSF